MLLPLFCLNFKGPAHLGPRSEVTAAAGNGGGGFRLTLGSCLSVGWSYLAYGFLLALLLSGCTAQLIPNTDVEDTARNRSVLEFMEVYRKAVERQDVELLLKLAHPDYYEDGGNIDALDDLDRAGLAEYLRGKFAEAKAIRYEIRYRRVGIGRNDTLYIDFTYSASYQLPSETGDKWQRTVAENRMEVVPHQDQFLILSGM